MMNLKTNSTETKFHYNSNNQKYIFTILEKFWKWYFKGTFVAGMAYYQEMLTLSSLDLASDIDVRVSHSENDNIILQIHDTPRKI